MIGRPYFGHGLPGTYLVIEGIGGCGKTTQAELLVKHLQEEFPGREILRTHEPGGSEKSQQIREVLISKPQTGQPLIPKVQAYLFAAARGQSLAENIRPVLERGGIVVSDRSFFTSLAYQGGPEGLGWQNVLRINEEVIEGTYPDAVFFLDVPVELGLERIDQRDRKGNIYDEKDKTYFNEVRGMYRFFAGRLGSRFCQIDGTLSIEEQEKEIWNLTRKFVEEKETNWELQQEVKLARRGKER